MQIIPTIAVPAQNFNVTVGDQNCRIAVYQKTTGIYLDLIVENVPKVQGVLCHDRVLLVRQPYLGFVGDLCFVDTQGSADPAYMGLGTRWILAYLEPSDLASIA